LIPEGYYNPATGNYYYYLKDHLGNNRITYHYSGSAPVIDQEVEYYPFGSMFAANNLQNNLYLYNGKELNNEFFENYDYGARFYDAQIGRWHGIDPLTEERSFISPYNFVQNNPISRFDPDGARDAPIYDRDANFLGTDDQGLQGKAIVMDKDKFTQGMSHEEALSNSLGAEGLSSNAATSKLLTHYDNLKSRPDYDGFVTRSEGIDWAKTHVGALDKPTSENMLYIDASKLDFVNISTSKFNNENPAPINLLNPVNLAASASNERLQGTVYALGRVNMQLVNKESKSVSIVNDYNNPIARNRATDYNWNKGGGIIRNSLISTERTLNGLNDTHGFRTYYYGKGKLNW